MRTGELLANAAREVRAITIASLPGSSARIQRVHMKQTLLARTHYYDKKCSGKTVIKRLGTCASENGSNSVSAQPAQTHLV
jgi:hypothetical protein